MSTPATLRIYGTRKTRCPRPSACSTRKLNIGGQDIAQKCAINYDGVVLEWNDPYAYVTDSLGRTLLDVTGDITSPTSRLVYHFTVPANTLIKLDAGEANLPPPLPFAVQVSLLDPDGNEIYGAIANPYETYPTVLPLQQPGKYTIVVTAFHTDFGNFYVKVNEELVTPAPKITSNFNLLVFRSLNAQAAVERRAAFKQISDVFTHAQCSLQSLGEVSRTTFRPSARATWSRHRSSPRQSP